MGARKNGAREGDTPLAPITSKRLLKLRRVEFCLPGLFFSRPRNFVESPQNSPSFPRSTNSVSTLSSHVLHSADLCVDFFLARKRARETGRRTETTGNTPNRFYFCFLLHE